jgi:glycosyltransferase involved in cell wall biosynthesis
VVVTTPWYEPFGMVALEAMACGRPLVASAVGGLQDTVLDGRTGLLVPPRDPASLSAAVNALLAQPGRREAMGRRGRARAVAGYGWAEIADEVESAYVSLLASAPTGTPVLTGEVL